MEEGPGAGPALKGDAEFSRGLKRGTAQVKSDFYSLAQAFGELTGIDPIAKWGAEGAKRQLDRALAYAPRVQSFDQVKNSSDLADYIAGVVGEQIPNVATVAAGGGLGGAIARLGQSGVRGLLRLGAKELIKEHGPAKAREILERRVANAARAGAFGSSYALNTGEIQQGLEQQGTPAPGVALLAGIPVAGLDVAGLEAIIRQAFPKDIPLDMAKGLVQETAKHLLGRGAKGAALGAAAEVPTEVAQEIIQTAAVASQRPDLSLSEIIDQAAPRLKETAIRSALVGGLLGGAGGAVGGGLEALNAPSPPESPQETRSPQGNGSGQVPPRSRPTEAPAKPSPAAAPENVTPAPRSSTKSMVQAMESIPPEVAAAAVDPKAPPEARQAALQQIAAALQQQQQRSRAPAAPSSPAAPSEKQSGPALDQAAQQAAEVLNATQDTSVADTSAKPTDQVLIPKRVRLLLAHDQTAAAMRHLFPEGRVEAPSHEQRQKTSARRTFTEEVHPLKETQTESPASLREAAARVFDLGAQRSDGRLVLRPVGQELQGVSGKPLKELRANVMAIGQLGALLRGARNETPVDLRENIIAGLDWLREHGLAPARIDKRTLLPANQEVRKGLTWGQLLKAKDVKESRSGFVSGPEEQRALTEAQLKETHTQLRKMIERMRPLVAKDPLRVIRAGIEILKPVYGQKIVDRINNALAEAKTPKARRQVAERVIDALDTARQEERIGDLPRLRRMLDDLETELSKNLEGSPERMEESAAAQTGGVETEAQQNERSVRDVLPEKRRVPKPRLKQRPPVDVEGARTVRPEEARFTEQFLKHVGITAPVRLLDESGVDALIRKTAASIRRAKDDKTRAELRRAHEQLVQLRKDNPPARVLYMQHFSRADLRVPVIFLSERLKRSRRRVDALVHELGHLILRAQLRQAPVEVQRALVEELGTEHFDERFANALRYWALAREKPRTLLERWFKDLAQLIRRAWLWLQRRGRSPHPRFDAFMDWLVASAAGRDLEASRSLQQLSKDPDLKWLTSPTAMYMPYDPLSPDSHDYTRVLSYLERRAGKERIERLRAAAEKRGKGLGELFHSVWDVAVRSNAAWLRRHGLDWLADHFHHEPGTPLKITPFYQEVRILSTRFLNQIDRFRSELSQEAHEALLFQRDRRRLSPQVRAELAPIDRMMEELYQRGHEAGVLRRRRKNFFPLMYNTAKISAERQEFVNAVADLLLANKEVETREVAVKRASDIADRLVRNGGFDNPELLEELLLGPSFTPARQRRLLVNEAAIQKLRPWLVEDHRAVAYAYSTRLVRRIALQRRFGWRRDEAQQALAGPDQLQAFAQQLGVRLTEQERDNLWERAAGIAAEQAIQQAGQGGGVNAWDGVVRKVHATQALLEDLGLDPRIVHQPLIKLDIRLRAMYRDGAFGPNSDRDYAFLRKQVLPSLLGRLGLDSNPYWQHVAEGVLFYQNLRVLGAVTISSFMDFGTALMRVGSLRRAWRAINLVLDKATRKELRQLGREAGILQSRITDHWVTNDQTADGLYLYGKFQKWNEVFFRMVGLHHWTEAMRVFAIAAGKVFIEDNMRLARQGNKEAIARLAQLGLKPEGFSESEYVRALDTFVDEAVIRPTPAQVPAWMNSKHPLLRIIAHLKRFMWGYHNTVLVRLWNEAKDKPHLLKLLPFAMLAVYTLPFAMLAYETRRRLLGAPPHEEGFVWEAIQRSGMLGVYQILVDAEHAGDYGRALLAPLGPTISQLNDLLSNSTWQRKVVNAVPLVGTSPAARDWLAEQLGYER